MTTHTVVELSSEHGESFHGQPPTKMSAIVAVTPAIVVGEEFSKLAGQPHSNGIARIKFLYSDATSTYLQLEFSGKHLPENAIELLCKRIADVLHDPKSFALFSKVSFLK